MNDSIETDIFRRMRMTNLEQGRFEIHEKRPEDTVIGPERQRESCSMCHIQFPNENFRLWHQFVHVKEYTGFLDGKFNCTLPNFDFCIECPFTTCQLKFADFIDAKFHYMTAHQSCHLFCCGMRFESYSSALTHFQGVAGWENGHFLTPCFLCHCHDKLWPTREEYTAHLQGRENKCPFPACRKLFKLNEQAITHFFSCHYRHLNLDHRKIFLNYKYFMRYLEKQEERRKGQFHCHTCHRKFYEFKSMERHVTMKSCIENANRKTFSPVVPCSCGHQFVYCFHQRDILLGTFPVLREAVEHVLREAPFSGMPAAVCEIYRCMIRVIGDLNQRLLEEKYSNYHRMDPFDHTEMSSDDVAKLILGVLDYFWKIM